jgi:multiple sugar transport system substrate-binding protein
MISIGLVLNIAIIYAGFGMNFTLAEPQEQNKQQRQQITLTAILEDQGDPARWKSLLQPAMQELKARHPNISIELNYTTYPYDQASAHMLDVLTNKTPIDLISIDQIWLGKFAEKGLLTDLTNYVTKWGKIHDWYQTNFAGGVYKGKVYGIWAWTDVRGIWYWKDLLNKAGVDPNSLKTWDGYIASAKKLNAVLRPQGIEGVHLTGANHSPDIWYPYLWMLGGEIIKHKSGHPTKGTYWFPAYNSSAGVKATEFIKAQVDAGIKPQKQHFWGKEFLDRKFAVMIEALQHHVRDDYNVTTPEKKMEFEQKVGFIPMFPVPKPSYQTSTLMGGWEFSIPKTSTNKELAWELLAIIVEPKILAPYLAQHSNLPTQIPIGQGTFAASLNQTTPYYSELVSMLNIANARPSIPEYPQIAEHIHQALMKFSMG